MSFLLFKTSGNFFRKEVVNATHDQVSGEKSLKEAPKEGSCRSFSDATHAPLCMQQGRKDLQSPIETGGFCGTGILKPGYSEEQHVWKESPVDELVCKLVTQICFLPEIPTETVVERESKEHSESEDAESEGLGTAKSCVDCNVSEQVLSPFSSLEVLPSYVREKNKDPSPQVLEEVATDFTDGSVKFKSALRGGYEKLGLGPRPKLHVTWAPDVYDPPSTSASHTSSQNRRRHHHPKNDHKVRHKGKGSSHADSHKKSQKKMSRKSRQMSETFVLSGPTVASQKGKHSSSSVWSDFIVPPLNDPILKSARVSPFLLPQKSCTLSQVLPLGERELVNSDTRIPVSWHVQTQKLCL